MNAQQEPALSIVKLKEAAKKKYIKSGGVCCPYCGSQDLEGQEFNCESGQVWQEISCNACENEWTDIYTLTSIEPKQVFGLCIGWFSGLCLGAIPRRRIGERSHKAQQCARNWRE